MTFIWDSLFTSPCRCSFETIDKKSGEKNNYTFDKCGNAKVFLDLFPEKMAEQEIGRGKITTKSHDFKRVPSIKMTPAQFRWALECLTTYPKKDGRAEKCLMDGGINILYRS